MNFKICKDCIHHVPRFGYSNCVEGKNLEINLVTGYYKCLKICEDRRSDYYDDCGPEGKLFILAKEEKRSARFYIF